MDTTVFKGDLMVLCTVNLLTGVCYIDIVNTVGRETLQSTQRIANSTVQTELVQCLLPIGRYTSNHHPKMPDFSPCVYGSILTSTCNLCLLL